MGVRRAKVTILRAGEAPLSASTSHYLRTVLRLRDGDSFIAFSGDGREASAEILHTNSEGLLLVRLAEPTQSTQAPRAIHLIQSLPKGSKLDAIVQDATELGVASITVAEAARSVATLVESKQHTRIERLTRVAEAAARQCGRADVPAVRYGGKLTPALHEAATAHPQALTLLLDAQGSVPLAHAFSQHPLLTQDASAAIVIVVGPEGGFDDEERRAALQCGFIAVRLGPYTLRTETAAAAALGACWVLAAADS